MRDYVARHVKSFARLNPAVAAALHVREGDTFLEDDMKRVFVVVAAGAALATFATAAHAAALPGIGGLRAAIADAGLVEQAQVRVYVYGGRRYCFYFNGWRGPGWYRCGFAWRRGLGWGGVYGWNQWYYAPAARRFVRRDRVIIRRGPNTRERVIVRQPNTRTVVRSRTNTRGDVRTRATTRGDVQVRQRSRTRATTGAGSRGGAEIRARGNVRGGARMDGGGANMRGGGGASIQGGGSVRAR
jgi:hypothetical protein